MRRNACVAHVIRTNFVPTEGEGGRLQLPPVICSTPRRLRVLRRLVPLALVFVALPALAAAQSYPPEQGTLQVSDSTVAPGQQVNVSGNGYAAGTTVTITFQSDPVTVGSATTDASGAFSA